jgi:hypothetical protein
VSMQFPGVAGIAVNMQYIQRGGITVETRCQRVNSPVMTRVRAPGTRTLPMK